ncbi:M64 family metallopeptidase [Mucisphaera calidilacus]|uniref:IgA Peptidase M64 n=1 Tax=Mucisphaera calidilacus TaxID=2527982 RepID=A0A518BW66_9BACT|nr:M64 family metallopeptidase [Mucisphaera calidilacus]QDU71207.1 IgA Peptidase M64 [Mucisphaera calidilacus]
MLFSVRRCRVAVVCGALALLVLSSAVSAGYETIRDNGPNTNRVNMVFMGDGYTAGHEIDVVYPQHIEAMLTHVFEGDEDPFPRYEKFINVHRIDVVSDESGADIPPDGVFVDTALGSKYYHDGVTERLLYVSNSRARNALNAGLLGSDIKADVKVITVNSAKYGGGGGEYAVYAGGHASAPEIALHEIGHQFANLADEYAIYDRPYTGFEPPEVNATLDPKGEWDHWLGYVDPDHPEMGAIGVYEGSKYYAEGLYRPSQNSKMRNLGRPFDAVAREQLIKEIYEIVDPVDEHAGNNGLLADPGALWVDVIDPAVLDVSWWVDGSEIPGGPDAFDLSLYGYGLGTFEVVADVRDNTDWIRDEAIKDLAHQRVAWTVSLTGPAKDLDGSGVLDATDIDMAMQRLTAGDGFDLNGDGFGDLFDLDYLLGTMLGAAFGDATLDGRVDLNDLSLLAASFEAPGGWAKGDFTGDGWVDLADLSVLASTFGFGATVPEPSGLIAMGLMAGVRARRGVR